ncbi:hypothetical protein HPP92_010257 [Vanilla planifolia]|uniref:Uncharacterized protein n=1 Tax=Vanilla planifolia TaxID=51239 RepID=A0A835R215_VANPL|nr:hypothetical protein HPP92_010257 [Vanilla planifolia]
MESINVTLENSLTADLPWSPSARLAKSRPTRSPWGASTATPFSVSPEEDSLLCWMKKVWFIRDFPMRLLKWSPSLADAEPPQSRPWWLLSLTTFYQRLPFYCATPSGKLKVDTPRAAKPAHVMGSPQRADPGLKSLPLDPDLPPTPR